MDDSGYEYNQANILGHGAFAIVYKGCYKKDSTKEVAIKVIERKNLEKNPAILMKKEIKILQELQHDNIVRLFDCRENAKKIFLVMEYCNASDLSDFMKHNKMLKEETILPITFQLSKAMEQLFNKGIMHRDLKPQNILLHKRNLYEMVSDIEKAKQQQKDNLKPVSITTEDIIKDKVILKLADFGFARFLSFNSMAATLCGSPMYMAPEVITSQKYKENADLWSIGVIIFQALTTRAPFPASNPQQLRNFYLNNHHIKADLPRNISQSLKNLLNGLLEKDPNKRLSMGKFFKHPFITDYEMIKQQEQARKEQSIYMQNIQNRGNLQQENLLRNQNATFPTLQPNNAVLQQNQFVRNPNQSYTHHNQIGNKSNNSTQNKSPSPGLTNRFQYDVSHNVQQHHHHNNPNNDFYNKGSHSPVGSPNVELLSGSPNINPESLKRNNSINSINKVNNNLPMNSAHARQKHDSGDDILNDYVIVTEKNIVPNKNRSVSNDQINTPQRHRSKTVSNPYRNHPNSAPNSNLKLASPGPGSNPSSHNHNNNNFGTSSRPRAESTALMPTSSSHIQLNRPQNLSFNNQSPILYSNNNQPHSLPNNFNPYQPQTQYSFDAAAANAHGAHTFNHHTSNNQIVSNLPTSLGMNIHNNYQNNISPSPNSYNNNLPILMSNNSPNSTNTRPGHSPLTVIEEDTEGVLLSEAKDELKLAKTMLSMAKCHSEEGIKNDYYNLEISMDHQKYEHTFKNCKSSLHLKNQFSLMFYNEIIKDRPSSVLILERFQLYHRTVELCQSSLQKLKNAFSELKNPKKFNTIVQDLYKLYESSYEEMNQLKKDKDLTSLATSRLLRTGENKLTSMYLSKSISFEPMN